MDIGMYNSYLEVDFGKMKESFRKVQAAAGKRGVIPVLKANAYGIGLIPMADFLVNTMNCDVMAVAQTSEGVQLREGGFRRADIMLLGPAPQHAVIYAVENNLLLPVFNQQNARWASEAAQALGKTARVQIKIDTGMNRIGLAQLTSSFAGPAGILLVEHGQQQIVFHRIDDGMLGRGAQQHDVPTAEAAFPQLHAFGGLCHRHHVAAHGVHQKIRHGEQTDAVSVGLEHWDDAPAAGGSLHLAEALLHLAKVHFQIGIIHTDIHI